ncbi:hypothetical protein RB195_013731 [Necator americanus]|uniref:Uncharacterized protein n=1 Tax=Necator americanus TaxID=51031 RepID=A0ABR1DXI9_NECAM
MMQAKKIKYDVIGLAKTRRWSWRPHQHEYGKNIDFFEHLTTRVGCLRMRRCSPTPALTIFVAYAPTTCYEEKEVEASYMDWISC